MRKTLLIVMCAILCSLWVGAQVTTEPTPLQEDSENVAIYFHADQGNKGLMGQPASQPVYAHTGVEVKNSAGTVTNWKYAPNWGDNAAKYQLSYVSENLWKLEIGNIRTYYGVAADETVTRLCFVFRNANCTKEGKGDGNSDIFVNVVDGGFQLALTSNAASSVIDADNAKISFTAGTTEAADIKLYVGTTEIGSATGAKTLTAEYTFPSEGNYTVKATATRGGETLTETMQIVYAGASKPATSAPAKAFGVTKQGDSYVFQIAAPLKESVMLVGSWNDYQADYNMTMEYVMDTAPDGTQYKRFVKTVPASVTGKEFNYYYLVDRTIGVGEP